MRVGWTDGVRREVLPNGLTLLVQHQAESPAVAVVTLVRAGFFDEPDDWAGISHVLEHMFFKGTARRGVGEIARATRAAGGYLNAGTGYDHTTYYTVLPARALATAVDIQSDALRHAALDPDELRRELQVIIEEARRKRDTPGAVAHETMFGVLFDHHRIRRWRIGEEARLAGFTREDVEGYYRSRYRPSRTIVAIVGGIDPDHALALARDRFADWPDRAGAIDPGPDEPWRHEVRAHTLRGDVGQADLVLGWRTVPPLHPDHPALEVASAVLASGRAGWLQRDLREAGTVMSIGASQYAPTEVGVFSISADLTPDLVEPAVAGIARVLDRLRTRGPSAADLERVRTGLRARLARWLESAESRASALAHAEMTDGVSWLDRSTDRLLGVTPEQVRDAAARWLRPDGVAGVAYLPRDRGIALTPAVLHAAFQAPARRGPLRREGGTHLIAVPGVDIVLRPKSDTPLVTLRLHRARRVTETTADAGVGTLAVRSAVRGAGGLDAAGLALAFERLGGPVGGSLSADAWGFSATVLPEHLATAADLLRRVMWQPAFAPETIGVERDTLVREAVQVADDMFRYPFQLALGAAFRDAGYGVPAAGLAESLTALDLDAVRAWHASELATDRSVLVVVGDLDLEQAADALADVMLGVPASVRLPPAVATPLAPDPADRARVVLRDRAQTALAMVFPGPSRLDERRHAAEVWAAVAGGMGGRLFEALRERRSLAYTVVASAWQRHRAGALLTYIATSPDREVEAREAMLEELSRFRATGVTAEEADQAIAYLGGQAEVSRQTGGALAADLVDCWLAGDPLASLEDPSAPYRAVQPEQVQALVTECLDPDRRVEGVVRGGGPGGER